MSNFLLGSKGVAYYSGTVVADNTVSSATTAVTGGTAVTQIKDLKCNMTVDKADVTMRGGSGWKATASTLKDGTITFTYVYKSGDTMFANFVTSWVGGSELFFAALDGPTGSGVQGPAGNFMVSNISRDEPVAGAMMADIELSASSNNSWFIHA